MPPDHKEPSCIWSIGIFTGDSPLHLLPPNGHSTPLLTAAHISDLPSSFVADPFMVRQSGEWNMFFEIMSAETARGEIGLAKSRDGLAWRYQGRVLSEPFHLSYPYVFEWQGHHYMIPETLSQGAIVLYRAFRFPFEWKPLARLVEGAFADATAFRFQDMWWLFACSTPYEHDTLRLFYSTDLTHGWTEHPQSPVIARNPSAARPGGRVVWFDSRLIRYAQDCAQYYGHRLRAFEITLLSPTSYEEHECSESPILSTGKGWNSAGMHHADAHLIGPSKWLACVDGHRIDRGTTPFLSRLLGRSAQRT
jgi:hypothetical protein